MQELTILEAIPLLIWAGNLALILVLGVVSVLGSFWFRTEVNMVDKLQKFKWGSLWNNLGGSKDPWSWCFLVFFGEFLFGSLIAMVVSALVTKEIILPILGFILAGTLLLYGPRFVVDMVKGLKVNNKTGDLDRINKLEKELANLKTKVEEK